MKKVAGQARHDNLFTEGGKRRFRLKGRNGKSSKACKKHNFTLYLIKHYPERRVTYPKEVVRFRPPSRNLLTPKIPAVIVAKATTPFNQY